jgi:hypothetical protein
MAQKNYTLGRLSDKAKGFWFSFLFLVGITLVLLAGYYRWQDSSVECVACHSDKKKMTQAGYPYFYMTQADVEKQTRHAGIQCRACHLGDGRAKTADKAHEGMLKLMLLGKDNKLLPRKEYYPGPFLPSGDDDLRALMPKVESEDGEMSYIYEVRNVLYHDHNPVTMGYDPAIAKKTCGTRDCHPEQVEQFSHTIMGSNFRQRTMRTWLEPYGPHNCGPSFADTPPDGIADGDEFSPENYEAIVKEMNAAFSMEQAVDKQKICNVCHAGCLDCHYEPTRQEGAHNMIRKPISQSCLGSGRSSSVCHAGSERRRGDAYVGNDFSEPQGLPPDVHVKLNIQCADCHYQGKIGMGDQQRKASCTDCHIEIEDALQKSKHKDVTCAACHTGKVGGYQLTAWGPGHVAEKHTPFKKFSLYYGTLDKPIIMKDQKNQWIAMKPIPHTLGNFKKTVPPSGKILFRWPNGETRDPYYVLGTFDGLPSNNLQLAWFEMQNLAHATGKGRECDTCHGERQVSTAKWRFFDSYGAYPFEGTHQIIADSQGLHAVGIHNTTPIRLMPDNKLEDFAPWLFLGDIWHAPGDFSIKSSKEDYDRFVNDYKAIESMIQQIELKAKQMDKTTLQDYKIAKGMAIHNPEMGKALLKRFLVKLL